ncbi:MAG: Uma2 family endonuclease [Myxococcales bacterium]|nr:Uma2 family endonuclease [Myxococcales bacterium]
MAAEPALRARLSYGEYLELERRTPDRHELVDGVAYAMGGGTQRHALVITGATVALGSRLRGGACRLRTTEARIYFPAFGDAAYPDLFVVCGRPEVPDADRDAVTNPALVVEVLSPTTEAYDRGEKFRRYESLPSLREYLLVGVEREFVEAWTRNADGSTWTRRVWNPGDEVPLALGVTLPVDEIYELARAEAAAG